MMNESLIEQSAEDMAGALPTFPEKPMRLKQRKHNSCSFSHSGINGVTINGIPSSEDRLAAAFHQVSVGSGTAQLPTERKNSRKARNGFNKNGIKKYGSKDIWVRAHDEMDDLVMDKQDPEYDSAEDEDPIAFDFEKPVIMSNSEFDTIFANLVNEFLVHLRPEEVLATLRELQLTDQQKTSMPYLIVMGAMSQKVAKCEYASELLAFLSSRYISTQQMQKGFLKLLHDLPDISLDVPKAPEHLGFIIARAIADQILPKNFLLSDDAKLNDLVSDITDALKTSHSPPISAPAFCNGASKKNLRTYSGDQFSSGISSASDSLGASLNGSAVTGLTPAFELSDQAQEALKVAEAKLEDATNCVKFNSIWGKHCGLRATRELIKHIQQMITDYMETENVPGFEKEVRSLEAPHFHHEIVYQAILTSIETGTDEGNDKIVNLLKELCDSVIISYDQLCRGVKRCYAEMPLLQTETPLAYSMLNRFVESSVKAGYFPLKLAHERPSKARKRYVSEGDSLHYRR